MSIASIIEGLHLLYTGANGKPTYGITVRANGSHEEVEGQGLRRQWDVNDKTLIHASAEDLKTWYGLTESEAKQLQENCTLTRARVLANPKFRG